MALSGDAFANEVEALLGVLSTRVAQSRRLGLLDRQGVDVFTFREADHSVEIAIQCKGYERPFASDQIPALLDEIRKFFRKGPKVEEYWLVINRPITDRADRDQVESALNNLTTAGACETARLLDLDKFTQFLLSQAQQRIVGWIDQFRTRSISEFQDSMKVVEYIADVPFIRNRETLSNPCGIILDELLDFRNNVDPSNTGPYRLSPRLLLTASFGFGKTSTLQEIATRWLERDGVALYVPAALLPADAFTHTAGALESFLNVLLPDDELPNEIAILFIRESWKKLIRKADNWLLLVDAIDESDFWSDHTRLSALWSAVWQLGIPAIVSVREEVFQSRPVEFTYTSGHRKGETFFTQIGLVEWRQPEILFFLENYQKGKNQSPSPGFIRLKSAVEQNMYERVFGDIPRRPLFLGMLAADAWEREEPENRLDRLYERYFRSKLLHDRFSAAAGNRVVRAGSVFQRYGEEEATERLLRAMTNMAVELFENPASPGDVQILEFDEEFVRRQIRLQLGDFDEIEEITLNSLIMPLGRRDTNGNRLYRFAHKSYQDWLIARGLARRGNPDFRALPEAVAYFALMMLETGS